MKAMDRLRHIMGPIGLLLVAICLGVIGQLLMKHGTNLSGKLALSLDSARKAAVSPFIVGGVLCYAISAMFYIVVVSKLPLSYVYPLVAISYVVVTICSRLLFRETINGLRWAGLAVICAGVVLLALSQQHTHARAAEPHVAAPAGVSAPPPPESGP